MQKSYGIKGKICVNTFWYTSQYFKLDPNILEKMLTKPMGFLYAGEHERQSDL